MSQTSKKGQRASGGNSEAKSTNGAAIAWAGALPEGYQSTYLEPTGPQGFGEGLLNTLGLYKDTKAQALLPQAQANYASLSKAVKFNVQQAEETGSKDRKRLSLITRS